MEKERQKEMITIKSFWCGTIRTVKNIALKFMVTWSDEMNLRPISDTPICF